MNRNAQEHPDQDANERAVEDAGRFLDRYLPDPHEHPTLKVEDAGRFLDFGRAKSYQEAARFIATDGREGLPVVKFGRSLRVPTAQLLRLLGIDPS